VIIGAYFSPARRLQFVFSPFLYASVGVHPSDVADASVAESELISWSKHKKVVALGETGLDYYHTDETKAVQLESFTVHLSAASKLNLPVIVHTRNAREDTIDLIRKHGNVNSAGVLHCFTESWEMAKQALDLNYYISLSGIVTPNEPKYVREVAEYIAELRGMSYEALAEATTQNFYRLFSKASSS